MEVALTRGGRRLFPDLLKFGKALISSGDIDPIYPVLRHLQAKLPAEQALWMSLLYVAWYNLPSALAAWDQYPERNIELASWFNPRWPTGIERRGHRDPLKLKAHLEALVISTDHLPLDKWLRNGFLEPLGARHRQQNYRILNERLLAIYGNGRWATYKAAEILRRVHDFPIEAPDMGMRYSSGPRHGLALFYPEIEGQTEAAISALDNQGEHLRDRLGNRGLEVDIEELETLLCNFHSLYKGRYYVGHDIDEMQEQFDRAFHEGWLDSDWQRTIRQARGSSFPHQYLGEFSGREGIHRRRLSAYQRRGLVLIRRGGDHG